MKSKIEDEYQKRKKEIEENMKNKFEEFKIQMVKIQEENERLEQEKKLKEHIELLEEEKKKENLRQKKKKNERNQKNQNWRMNQSKIMKN